MKQTLFAILFMWLFSSQIFAQEAKLMLPIGVAPTVYSAQFSSDGKLIVTCSWTQTGQLWEAESGRLLRNFQGSIRCPKFSPDAKHIVFGYPDGKIQISDTKTGAVLANINAHKTYIVSLEYTADGRRIVSTARDSSIKVWDSGSGKLLHEFKLNRGIIFSNHVSPDGRKLIASLEISKTHPSGDLAKVWDIETGKLLFNLNDETKKENRAIFSPDSKMIFTVVDSVAKIWDGRTGRQILTFIDNSKFGEHVEFSPDGKKIAIPAGQKKLYDLEVGDTSLKIYNVQNGALLFEIKDNKSLVLTARFSPDGHSILVLYSDGHFTINSAETGVSLNNQEIQYSSPASPDRWHPGLIVSFSPDGKRLIISSVYNNGLKIWDLKTRSLITDLNSRINNFPGAQFSMDGKDILASSDDFIHPTTIWNIGAGKRIATIKGRYFSADGRRVYGLTGSTDTIYKVWDVQTGKKIVDLVGFEQDLDELYSNDPFSYHTFSSDNKKIYAISDNKIKIWDAEIGKMLIDLKDSKSIVSSVEFSPDATKLIAAYQDSSAKIWNLETGKLFLNIKMPTARVTNAVFSGDGRKIAVTATNIIRICDALSGKVLVETKPIGWDETVRTFVKFSPDNKELLAVNNIRLADPFTKLSARANIFDAETGKLIKDLKGHSDRITVADFSPDGKQIMTASPDGSAKLWTAETGVLITTLQSQNGSICDAAYSPQLKNIVTTYYDGAFVVWDARSYKKLYTYYAVDSTDYLVTDQYGRYDGTEAARKLLYFTCGTEVIGLDQVKDQLWVPNLAERIMKGDSINAKKLSDLNICGLIPKVEKEDKTGYHFMITPQSGGLGETVLYINDIEVKRYKAAQLTRVATGYELYMTDAELQPYFIAGQQNTVTVKAYTANNDISSRGAKIVQDETKKQVAAPNLYAVTIGVSDYKGPELLLKYAAKDAADISDAIKLSAGKLLGNDHVFIYKLTTSVNHYQLPEKIAVKNVLSEIGKKAMANDILLIFFAGHGVISGEKKQFYFLTADASQASAIDAPDQVGISTTELSDWMKPGNIKAQKRILILDACNSGQAINELVKVGNSEQNYLAARNDDKAEQIKAIDKLNEKSGLFILAASASNQSAYEMGRYSQGLLTYSLLKAIKQQPDILEDNKYLNVSRWFNAAEKTVSDMVRETGNRQEPQIVSAGNFNIGLVDQEVMSSVKLADEKPLFTASNLQNKEIDDDNLDLSGLINQSMSQMSARSAESQISYATASSSPDAWSLSGRYEVSGDDIIVKINIKQNKEVKDKLELKGPKSDLKALAEQVVNQATDWILKHK